MASIELDNEHGPRIAGCEKLGPQVSAGKCHTEGSLFSPGTGTSGPCCRASLGKSALLLAQDSPAVLESQPDACLEPSPKRLKCEKGKELRSF